MSLMTEQDIDIQHIYSYEHILELTNKLARLQANFETEMRVIKHENRELKEFVKRSNFYHGINDSDPSNLNTMSEDEEFYAKKHSQKFGFGNLQAF